MQDSDTNRSGLPANALLFDSDEPGRDITTAVVHWMFRSHATSQEWVKKGESVYLSVNGDSVIARNRMASLARKYFVQDQLITEDVKFWTNTSKEIQTKKVNPPKISDSNAGHVDWLYVADYCLLACAVLDAFADENTARDAEFLQVEKSYQLRMQIIGAREAVRENPGVDDATLLKLLQTDYKDISIANIKEARRLEKSGTKILKPKQPIKGELLPRYKSIYF